MIVNSAVIYKEGLRTVSGICIAARAEANIFVGIKHEKATFTGCGIGKSIVVGNSGINNAAIRVY